MKGNPYWAILESILQKNGFEVYENPPRLITLKWLVNHRNKVNILHIHFIHQFYASSKPGRVRLIYVLLFGMNLIAARLLGYKTIFTLHDLEPTYPAKPAWVDFLGHYFAVNLTCKVIVHCSEAKRLMTKKYGRKRQVQIVNHPNFINYYPNSVSKLAAREKLRLPDDATVFTFFGGIRPNKGIENLISAFQSINDDNFRLVIAGKPNKPMEYAQTLVDLAKTDKRISFFYEQIPDDKVQIFMNSADIVVLPFSKILTSGSAILAMSFKRPVIVPSMGCLSELIKIDAGWKYVPGDTESLAEAITIAASSDFVQCGINAYKHIIKDSPDLFAAQTIEAFHP